MSIQTQVLYGNRLYDQETYSTNQDPETIMVVLTDSTALSDAQIVPLEDSMVASDATTTIAAIKALADTLMMADAKTASIIAVLADSSIPLDGPILVLSTKALTDFVRLNEWLTITIQKAEIWTMPAVTNVSQRLYGPFLYSQPLYGSIPSSAWTNANNDPQENFTNFDGEGNVP